MNFSEIKLEAKDVLSGNRLMMLVAIIVVGALGALTAATIIGSIIAPILVGGLFWLSLKLFETKEIDFYHLFIFFKDFNHAAKLIGVAFLTAIFVLLGTLLFVIPGIIFAYRYSQALYIMAENPDLSVTEAMKQSQEMMRGYKMNLFFFHLSFFFHFVLGVLTFGLYFLYIIPYIVAANVNYYRHLSGQRNKKTTKMIDFN
ncbi:MAG: DUF975 family protein [Acholeplasmataceae bacterium]|nr:DUF975 family protein [Acholeplasmataceae bacterium]